MRPSCYFCARKHISKANIKFQEARLGYPEHIDLGLAELSEAEDELLAERPDLANVIRGHRKKLEESLAGDPTGAGYNVPIMDLLKVCREQVVTAEVVPANVAIFPAKPLPVPSSVAAQQAAARTAAAARVAAMRAGGRPAHLPAPIMPGAQKSGCTPCQEAAKLREAGRKWQTERTSGEMIRTVAIIAPLSDFNPSYSLVTVILDQVRATALLPKTRVVLLVRSQANCDLLPPLSNNVDVLSCIPHIGAGEDQVGDREVAAAKAWLKTITSLLGQAYVFTHDLVFQSWFSHWAKALHEMGAIPGIHFYHWMHSSVGTRPSKPEAQWRTSVPVGHKMVALNTADLPYLYRYYQAEASSFVSIPNSRDVRVFYGMPQRAADLVTKHQLHTADIVQVYPLSGTRMQAKGVTKVIDVFNALCRVEPDIVCRLLIADAHANGTESENNRQLVTKYAKSVGLPDGVLAFASESVSPGDGDTLSKGLDAVSIRCLLQIANLFIFPTTSEAGSLVLMEAAMSGNLLVLNESLPCMADYISTTDAIWVPFGSTKESAGAWNAVALADRIHAELSQNKMNVAKRAILREHSLEGYRDLLLERVFTPVAPPVENIPARPATLLSQEPAAASP